MAIDQALLEAVDGGTAPVLRFYRWTEPTLSLGYFQKASNRNRHSASQALTMVRRATGGGAIVHDSELTYSFAWPLEKTSTGARTDLYRQTHRAVIAALSDFGIPASRWGDLSSAATEQDPFLCFMRRTDEDLIVSGYKVVGSAQRTGRRAVLQHGSILLAASPHAPELPGVNNLAGKSIDALQLADRVANRIAEVFSLNFVFFPSDEAIKRRAMVISQERFDSQNWNEKR
ncbi:Octanoyltransferase LipM [Novipirellula artificiosorum]|uniref:Octanoyltransferase LipM n=2 Tax=Novipirellula artificiosorum TaxID=2528016 RepID=A0A5C6DX24_9BACT|nr:Octanoyltransferase LipM [Novipirellula artificiosorum]